MKVDRWPRHKALQVRGIIARLGICGCGSGRHWDCVIDILYEARSHTLAGYSDSRWHEFAAHMLEKHGLLKHGISINGAWLTEDGELLLEFLRDFGLRDYDIEFEDIGHPEWSVEFSWSEKENPKDTYGRWVKSHGMRSYG